MTLTKYALKKAGIFSRHNYINLARYLKSQGRLGLDRDLNWPKDLLGESLQAKNAWSRAVAEYILITSEKGRRVAQYTPVMKRNWTISDLLRMERFHGQMVGVEIEKTLPRNVEGGSIVGSRRFINVTSDGSINPPSGFYGAESRLVFVRGISEDRLVNYCKHLATLGARVNASCGLHIHLDQRGVNRSTAWRRYNRLVEALPWLKMCVSPSRLENQYCRLNVIGEGVSDNRYRAINWASYSEHCTIEVRLLNGTIDANKILHWVNLCVASSENSLPTLDAMLNCSAIPTSSKLWYLERKKKFYPDDCDSDSSDDS